MKKIIAIIVLVLGLGLLFFIKNISLHEKNAETPVKPHIPHRIRGNLTTEEGRQIFANRWSAILALESKGGNIMDLMNPETFSEGEIKYIEKKGRNFKIKLALEIAAPSIQWLSDDEARSVNFLEIQKNLKNGFDGIRMSKFTPGADGYMEIHSRSFARLFLSWSVNMTTEGLPRYAYEDEKYFYFSGGGRAYEVSDFSSGCAIEKSTSKISFWDINEESVR